MDTITEAIVGVAEDGLRSDKALLTLCEALVARTNQLGEYNKQLSQQIIILQERILDLYKHVEILTEMYHTHFTEGKEVH
jgi:hypothetical protein